MHSLIVLIHWQDEMYSDVLRLYFNKTVKIDDSSLKTLVILFKTRGFCSVSLNKTVSIKWNCQLQVCIFIYLIMVLFVEHDFIARLAVTN